MPEAICLPTVEDARVEAELYNRMYGFPPICYGAIGKISNSLLILIGINDLNIIEDGSHVKVMPPKDFEAVHMNRKSTLSLNVLVLGGASGRAYFVKSNAPGSYHDAHCLSNSTLFDYLNSSTWHPLTDGVILGDSAFPTYHK